MLVWRKGNIEKKNCYSSVYYYNGAERYEQLLQVGRLYWALILFSLARCLLCFSVSSVFMVLYIYLKKNLLTSFSLPSSELSLVGLAIDMVD